MPDRAAPAVFSIAPGRPFLDLLAAGILERWGDTPETLSRVTVLLPTRRACRALTEAFLRQRDGRALLLPEIRPLGDVDEDELDLRGIGEADDAALPFAPLERDLQIGRAHFCTTVTNDHLVCRLLLEKNKTNQYLHTINNT